MSKEVKVGLGVIFSLTLVFGYTVYDRFVRPAEVAVAGGVTDVSTDANIRTPVVRPKSSAVSASRFDVAPAAQWEEAKATSEAKAAPVSSLLPKVSAGTDEPSPSTTFRAVEKPVLELRTSADGQASPTAAVSAPVTQVVPVAGTEQVYQPAPLSVQPLGQEEVQPAAAQAAPSGGYQPPRVLSSAGAAAQQYQAPTQQQSIAQQPVSQQPIAQRPIAQRPVPSQESYPTRTQRSGYGTPAGQQDYQAPVSQRAVPTDYRQTAQVSHGGSNMGTYRIQPNDTFWTVSRKVYGSGNYFKALARHNSVKFPSANSLAVGDVVDTPTQQALMQQYPELCPKPRRAAPRGALSSVSHGATGAGNGRAYEVQDGDTLFDIARYELGDGSRWIEIYQLNQNQLTQDFDYIKPGTKIMLPGRGKPQRRESVARDPRAGVSR